MCAYTHWRPLSILPPLPLLHDITDNETPPTPVGPTKSHTLRLHEVKRRSVSQSTIHYITRVLCHQQWMCQPWATSCTYQLVVLSPDLLSTVQEERESGEYCTTPFVPPEFQLYNLIGWFGNYPSCTGLPFHKPLIFTHLPIYWSPARHFKRLPTQLVHSVRMSPDPPFLFEGGSGTRLTN